MTRTAAAAIDCTLDPVGGALLLARRFGAGDRLIIAAPGCVDHAHHVAVEFIHPVVAGARSLPALVAPTVAVEGRRPTDCLLVIGDDPSADLSIPSTADDATIMRSYHVLWELVQVCLEHPGIVGVDAARGGDSTGFLYPFLDASETDEDALRTSLEASAAAKHDESIALTAATLEHNRHQTRAAGESIVNAVGRNGRVLAMGNGGSSTDAARLTRLLTTLGVDAMSIAVDYAVLSALSNDLGAEHVFARQLEALARPGDVVIGCSTSGASPNLLRAFEFADGHGMIGIGISGYRGGAFAQAPGVDHCLAVDSSSVHRIQEGQAGLINALCDTIESIGSAT